MKIAAKILFAVLFCLIPVCSQQPVETDEIRVETSLVSVPVRVTDRRNRNITGLEKKNFRVYEDGIEQTVESFEDNNAPLTVAIMLDASNSTTAQLKNIKAAAFLDRLRPHDRVMIFSFDRNLVKIADGTIRDLPSIQNSISLSQTGGGTSLYDSVVAVNQNYLGEISGRKALIILTDGIDTQSVSQTSAGSLRAMEEADVLVYSIQYDTVPGYFESEKSVFRRFVRINGRVCDGTRRTTSGGVQKRNFIFEFPDGQHRRKSILRRYDGKFVENFCQNRPGT